MSDRIQPILDAMKRYKVPGWVLNYLFRWVNRATLSVSPRLKMMQTDDGTFLDLTDEPFQPARMKVVAVYNDYLGCKALDENDDPIGEVIYVAKHYDLRNTEQENIHNTLTDLEVTIDGTQTLTFDFTSDLGYATSLQVKVAPPYRIVEGYESIIWAMPAYTGITAADGSAITLEDSNRAGRVMAGRPETITFP